MDRFETCLPRVLAHEGGWSNHPKDPGGATMQGITQRTYDAWRKARGLPVAPVRDISAADVAAIYREQYWRHGGRGLPPGVDYAVFDYAVNSGPAQAARDLQRVLGVPVDGVIGAHTISAAVSAQPVAIIEALCERRLRMLRGLKTWGTFGRGWQRRVDQVLMTAVADATGQSIGGRLTPAPGHADPDDKSAGRVARETATNPAAIAATAGAVLGPLAPLATGTDGPLPWAIAAVLVIVAVTGAVMLLRRREA